MIDVIASNLRRVRERIGKAAARAGRSADDVELVAVTKRRDPETIRELIGAGQFVLGENRVREALDKMDYFRRRPLDRPLEWHLIGHVQTNKARPAAGRFALIHSVDSLRLVEALQRAAERDDSAVDILLQVNVSAEESKFGLQPEALERVASELRHYERVRCKGLMTMAALEDNPEATRPVFRNLRRCRDRLRDAGCEHIDLDHLSMGMSNDFEVAVEEGATIVRIGSALFAEVNGIEKNHRE